MKIKIIVLGKQKDSESVICNISGDREVIQNIIDINNIGNFKIKGFDSIRAEGDIDELLRDKPKKKKKEDSYGDTIEETS